MLEKGARKGDFTEADLDALMGGELALVVTPLAVQRVVEHQERQQQRGDDAATPMAHAWDEPVGVTAVLLPGDPDAAWDYVERQVADLAAKLDVPVEEISHGSGELLWVEMPDPRERLSRERLEDALGDADLQRRWQLMVDSSDAVMTGARTVDRASRRAGPAISSSRASARPTSPRSSTLSTGQPIHLPIPRKRSRWPPISRRTRCHLPTSMVRRSWTLVGERTLQKLQAMTSPAEQAVWQAHTGLAISAVEAGFRIDAVVVPGESGDLGSAAIANDPAIAAAAERVPAGTFLYQAGVVPENAFAGAAYMLALAVNGDMAGEESQGGGLNQLPSEEEIEEEIATAAATLGFDPRSELFDLLGGEFIAFSSFPSFDMNGFGLDAVAAVTTSDPDTLTETTRKIAAAIERAGSGVGRLRA